MNNQLAEDKLRSFIFFLSPSSFIYEDHVLFILLFIFSV